MKSSVSLLGHNWRENADMSNVKGGQSSYKIPIFVVYNYINIIHLALSRRVSRQCLTALSKVTASKIITERVKTMKKFFFLNKNLFN